MAKTFHRDDQDWKSTTSDYTTPKKNKKISPQQTAQSAELLSWETLEAIKDRYLNQDEVDMTDEWKSFLDDE